MSTASFSSVLSASGPRPAATTRSASAARRRTACPGRRRADRGPATGARSARRPPSRRRSHGQRPGRRPSPARRRDPRPGTGTSYAPAPSSRDRTPRPSASHRPDRSRRSRCRRHQTAQPSQPRVAVAVTPGHATTVGHERPPPAMGHQARSASGGRSYARHRHAERLSMPLVALVPPWHSTVRVAARAEGARVDGQQTPLGPVLVALRTDDPRTPMNGPTTETKR